MREAVPASCTNSMDIKATLAEIIRLSASFLSSGSLDFPSRLRGAWIH